MATETNETWGDVRLQILATIDKLQTWRDYEEEVGYDPDNADRLTDAIGALLDVIAPNVNLDMILNGVK